MKTEDDALKLPLEDNIDAVVVGWDINFNYAKLVAASLCMQRNKVDQRYVYRIKMIQSILTNDIYIYIPLLLDRIVC